ncbi:CD109 antigen-like [Mercenaria mercenaria]|uniref:CD109 antigen-like n=1 Tax=Mercenaria mercenaria TaxID=6596 RepID=UPI00234F2C7D|nr:CD109 antigen-like [Mercenaria mercenaria]
MPDTMLVIILLTVSATLVEGTYVASFPNSLLPGISLKIRVHTSSASANVHVGASLKYAQNDTVVQTASSSVQNGISKTIDLKVPDNLMPSQYKVSITGSGGLSFHNESKIHYEEDSLFLLIQTDKSRYSAGQLVRFRVAFILPNLLNYQGKGTITIKDGKGNKIEVIGPQQVTDGVMSGKLQLSNEPVFGEWEIIADARETSSSKVIEVYDYILPKFLVDIKMPEVIKTTQASLPIDISARFTFNKDVLGNCTILIYNEKKTWYNMQFSKEIQGTTRFTIPMSQFKGRLEVYSKINIRATVTDHATALSMVTEREIKFTFDEVLQPLTINKVDYKDSFIPGMTYETNVSVIVKIAK